MKRKASEEGFALIEALVALGILALSLTVLFRITTDYVRRSRAAETSRAAELVAQSQLSAAGVLFPLDGREASGIEGPFFWRVDSTPYGGDIKSTAGRLWLVSAGVRRREGGPDILVLRSVRLAPAD